MKIGVIGANGKAGRLIAQEAAQRGHEVTVIVRDKKKIADKGYAKVLERDLFALGEDDLRNLDAVVCAVSLSLNGDDDKPYQKAMDHFIGVLKNIPNVRLLVVGGAASLYTDPQKKHPFLEQIPEKWRAVPADMAKAYAKLGESSINWTFFSPAVTFDPKGRRTGKYTIGSDYVITNASNESYISYEDYAIAMVDEIENKFHTRRRFTAVSDSKPETLEKAASIFPKPEDGYYGILKKKPEFYGLARYCPPFNYELAGKQFRLVMDKENDYYVSFLTGSTLEWSKFSDAKIIRENYECAKIDDLTYFVNFELSNYSPRTNITLVLDMEQRLVTFVRTYTGFSERYPYLVESDFDFGAIDIPGFPLPDKRHGYTTDLVGKRACWTYGPNMSIVHVYYSPNYIRATFPPDRKPQEPADPGMREEMERYPYDEPTTYIKIKHGIYVVSVIEKNRSRRGDTGNSLLFLMDMIRVHDVGRSFGNTPPDSGAVRPENYLFAAYGDFVYSDGVLESQKNVYIE
jgi:uncharacterized protein